MDKIVMLGLIAVFVLAAVLVASGTGGSGYVPPHGLIPRPAVEQSSAIFGTPKVVELRDGTFAVDVTSPGGVREVVAQSYAGEDWKVIDNPAIKDEDPAAWRYQNVLTDQYRQTLVPTGFSTSAGPAFWGAAAGVTAFVCTDFGAGLFRSAGSPVINAAVKASALKIPEPTAPELLAIALVNGGRITTDDLGKLESQGLLSREAAQLARSEIEAGRPVRFIADAAAGDVWAMLRPSLEATDEIALVETGGQTVNAVRSGAHELGQAMEEPGSPVRIGSIVFEEGLPTMTLEWVPSAESVGRAELGCTEECMKAMIRRWETAMEESRQAAVEAARARAQLQALYRPRGWCGIQVDHTIDAISRAAQLSYEHVATGDIAWAQYLMTREPAAWRMWLESPRHAEAMRAIEQAIRQSGESSPEVTLAVGSYVEAAESSSVPQIVEVSMAPRPVEAGAAKPAIAAQVPQLPEALSVAPKPKAAPEVKPVPMLPAPPSVPLLAAPRMPLMITAGESIAVPLSDIIGATRPVMPTFIVAP